MRLIDATIRKIDLEVKALRVIEKSNKIWIGTINMTVEHLFSIDNFGQVWT